MKKTNELIEKALKLKPKEKASMIEALIKSLDAPDEAIDALWKQECESRINAYEKGTLKAVSVQEAFAKYQIDAG